LTLVGDIAHCRILFHPVKPIEQKISTVSFGFFDKVISEDNNEEEFAYFWLNHSLTGFCVSKGLKKDNSKCI
tara:strand:+ start:4819 stop:5034 length:216 start_codon:yes stop_codon:yes gene_type:complete